MAAPTQYEVVEDNNGWVSYQIMILGVIYYLHRVGEVQCGCVRRRVPVDEMVRYSNARNLSANDLITLNRLIPQWWRGG